MLPHASIGTVAEASSSSSSARRCHHRVRPAPTVAVVVVNGQRERQTTTRAALLLTDEDATCWSGIRVPEATPRRSDRDVDAAAPVPRAVDLTRRGRITAGWPHRRHGADQWAGRRAPTACSATRPAPPRRREADSMLVSSCARGHRWRDTLER